MTARSATARVLVVDDDPNQVRLISWSLSAVPGRPYQTDGVSTFDEGIEAVRARRHDAFLIDQRLGSMLGTDLIARAREMGSPAAMVIMTAHRDADADAHAVAVGADAFLLKGETDSKYLDRTLRFVLKTASDRASIASARRQLEAIEQAGAILSDHGPTNAALARTLAAIQAGFGFNHLSIYWQDGRILRLGAQLGYAAVNGTVESSGLLGQTLGGGTPRLLPNVTIDPDHRGPSVPASELAVPIVVDDQPVGLLLVGSPSDAPIGQEARAALATIGKRIGLAAALDRERREVSARSRRCQRLTELGQRLVDLADGSAVASAVLDALQIEVPSRTAAILASTAERTLGEVLAASGADPVLGREGRSLAAEALREGRPQVQDVPGASVTAVPISRAGRCLAVLVVERSEPTNALDRETLGILAAGLALGLAGTRHG